ncbi:MAG: spermidine/putrescine ABC transporter substrate-binding protein [Motiliproteus sp.]
MITIARDRQTSLYKLGSTLLLALICSLTAGICWSGKSLVILNWPDYLDPALVSQFESENHIQIRQIFYNSDEERTERLLETEGRGYDLMLVAGIDLKAYIKHGWLRRLPLNALKNGHHIDPYWHNRFPSAKGYAVPFSWGTLGIIYRTDLLSEPIISWQQLFQPNEQLSGHIGMISTPRDLVGMGLKSLGYSANTENPLQLEEARSLIKQQAPHVKTYNYLSIKENSEILGGNVYAAMMFNGDALKLQQFDSNLQFVLPVEGGNLWVDYLAIPVHAKEPTLATKFIDFINRPEHASQQASYSHFAPPHRAAIALLSEGFLEDERIFPHSSNFSNSEIYQHMSPETLKHRNETVAQIRH